MRDKKPVASRVVTHPSGNALWLIKWPSTMTKWGKSYYASTYHNSELIFMETAAKRRPVSPFVGRKILPQIKQAIAEALERGE